MDKKQNEKLFDEVAELPKDVYEKIIEIVFDEPHNWCMINQRNKKIYRMFDEIVIDDDDDENN